MPFLDTNQTRSSAIAEEPRDALCQLNFIIAARLYEKSHLTKACSRRM